MERSERSTFQLEAEGLGAVGGLYRLSNISDADAFDALSAELQKEGCVYDKSVLIQMAEWKTYGRIKDRLERSKKNDQVAEITRVMANGPPEISALLQPCLGVFRQTQPQSPCLLQHVYLPLENSLMVEQPQRAVKPNSGGLRLHSRAKVRRLQTGKPVEPQVPRSSQVGNPTCLGLLASSTPHPSRDSTPARRILRLTPRHRIVHRFHT